MNDSLGLVFARNVDLYSVNPDNNALKNQYIDSLICTSLAIFTKLGNDLPGIDFKVVKGFISRSKLFSTPDKKPDAYEVKHAKGLGIEITWDGYSSALGIDVAKRFFDESKNDFEILVFDNSIGFYRGIKHRKVVRMLEGKKYSVIHKAK